MNTSAGNEEHEAYTNRLVRLSGSRLKTILNVQAPYRWNIRRRIEGFVLDVGCGIGRNLEHLGGTGVGVDVNPLSVAEAQQRGLTAFTLSGFASSEYAVENRFDSLLIAHVLEHMEPHEASALVSSYLPYVKSGGAVVVICPQQRGYASDETHVNYLTADGIKEILRPLGLIITRSYSFPFPTFVGRIFTHNETIVLARKP